MTRVNRPSRKELVALGAAITFAYVGAYVSAYLQYVFFHEVFWWTGGVCWFLAPVLLAWFGYRLAKRRGWGVVIVTVLAVIPWTVTTALAILMVAMIVSSFQ